MNYHCSLLTIESAVGKLQEIQKLHESTKIYCEQLAAATQLIRPKLAKMRRLLSEIVNGTTLMSEVDGSMNGLAEQWTLLQHRDIEFKTQPMLAAIAKFLRKQQKCVANIELIHSAHKIQFDPMRVPQFTDPIVVDQRIQITNLLNWFHLTVPTIRNESMRLQPPDMNESASRAHLLWTLSRKLDGTTMRFNYIGNECDVNANSLMDSMHSMRSIVQFSNLTVRIKSLLINTPPIAEEKSKPSPPTKRPRIFSLDFVEPPPCIEQYELAAQNLSTLSDNGSFLGELPPKRFRCTTFSADATASTSFALNQKKQFKTNAMVVLRNIQMLKSVGAMKSSRRSIQPKSVTDTFTPVRVKTLETLQGTPKVAPSHAFDVNHKNFLEKIGKENLVKNTHHRNRLSLDAAESRH